MYSSLPTYLTPSPASLSSLPLPQALVWHLKGAQEERAQLEAQLDEIKRQLEEKASKVRGARSGKRSGSG